MPENINNTLNIKDKEISKLKIALSNTINIILENNIYDLNNLQYEIGLTDQEIKNILKDN